MHEFPITSQIVKIAQKHAEKAQAVRVLKINLVVGDYSGYIGDAIRLYFDILSEGTLCEGAELSIRRVEPMLRCTACGELFKKEPYSFACPKCGGEGGPSEIGKEFYIDSIEVE